MFIFHAHEWIGAGLIETFVITEQGNTNPIVFVRIFVHFLKIPTYHKMKCLSPVQFRYLKVSCIGNR